MKYFIGISLFIFWAIVAAILTAGLVFYQNKSLVSSNDPIKETPPTVSVTPKTVLNTAEVAKHNSPNDCWMIINGKVYDLTPYIGSHPGGDRTILKYCGQDGSKGFATKDKNAPHSSYAASQLNDYFIGNLNQSVNRSENKPDTANSQNNLSETRNNTGSTGPNQAGQASGSNNQVKLDAKTVAKHNSPNDCWMIINGKVYNLTPFLSAHPGGVGTMTPYCGQDGSRAFATKDIGRPHSSYAQSLLGNYFIGDLNQAIDQNQLNTSVQNTNSVTPPAGGESEVDDD
jgi:cytochrome b involved in lipid metabolism